MPDPAEKAFADLDGMIARARRKQAGGGAGTSMQTIVSGPETQHHQDLGHAQEQYRHNIDWVFACVSLVAQRVAGQPFMLARQTASRPADKRLTKAMRNALPMRHKTAADKLEPIETHPLLDVLHDPNDLMTTWSLMTSAVSSMELTGRGLWWKIKQQDGRPGLLPVPTHWIEKIDLKARMWQIRPEGGSTTYPVPFDEMAYNYYPDPANPRGGAISPLQRIARCVTADEAISTAQIAAFRNGIFPKYAIKAGRLENPVQPGRPGMRPVLTKSQKTQLIQAIRGLYAGISRADEPFIIDGLIDDIVKLSSSIAEMDFINSAGLTKSKILQGFRVNPILLGEVEGANRASAWAADHIFVSNKVNPLLQLLSECATEWLGPMFAQPDERLVVWWEPAVANDAELTFKQWQIALTRGVVTDDEYRHAMLGLPAKETKEQSTQDVQASALNGAQIDSLLKIVEMVSVGDLSTDAAQALIQAAFPLLTSEQISGIVNALQAGSVEPGSTTPPAIAKRLAAALNPYTLALPSPNGNERH